MGSDEILKKAREASTRVDPCTFFGSAPLAGYATSMNTITNQDTLASMATKLRRRCVVIMRIGLTDRGFYAMGSRADTFKPAIQFAPEVSSAIAKVADVLDPPTILKA